VTLSESKIFFEQYKECRGLFATAAKLLN